MLVQAHPDDESFMGGGASAFYARHGVETTLVTFTDGQAGRAGVEGHVPVTSTDELGCVRRRELGKAVAVLGIGRLVAPGWMDGQLESVENEKGIRFVSEQLEQFRPGVVSSFGPEGAPNNHPDHIACGRWTQLALERMVDSCRLSRVRS
jgi:LmbE family N-acetylglucosaminyl deacetylase